MGSGHDPGGERRGNRSRPFTGKPPDWLELWAFGRCGLGLSDKEFWHLTLVQLNALIKQNNLSERARYWRAALICSVLANCHRDPKKGKAYKPEDFMPKYGKATKEMSEQEMLTQLKLMNASLGGETRE